MFGKLIANTFIKPFQSPVFDDPKNYDLEYEDVTFEATDGVTLSGWLIKGDSDKVIIQSHFGVDQHAHVFKDQGRDVVSG